ncbi:MAG: hypothetical protein RLZZ15_2151, partial [Verrucomicrobiota bacterium]
PYAWASRGLTTLSLASCDAADYAGGARTLMEFARADRGGFLGLTEVVRVMSADNFFDYWTRLNHFTPAALIAFNGSVLRCAPHELTGLVTLVLLATTLPGVFWTARAVAGFSSTASLWVAALCGVSPLLWYAVGHVAMGQLLAAQAIALLTWAGVAQWRAKRARLGGVLALGYALLLGSYNFMLLGALVPVGFCILVIAVWRGEGRRFARWIAALLLPLALAGGIFFERIAGLVERFQLLDRYDFGWRIPVLGPDGWLGLVSGPELRAWEFFNLHRGLALLVAAMLAWAFVRAAREHRRAAWVAGGLALPVLAGYALLTVRGETATSNSSYNAYKLFAVFYPVTLPAFCWWLTLRGSRRLTEWMVVAAAAGVVLLGNAIGSGMIGVRLATAPFSVDGELRQLRKIEAMPDVKSVNVLLPDMWSRLWANAFLLRTPQYFATDTYEARWHTPLRGDWDLTGGILAVKPTGDARRQLSPRFALVDTRAPTFLRAGFGDGWHEEERDPKSGATWRWTKADAALRIENPQRTPLRVVVTLDGWSFGERELTAVGADGVATPAQSLGAQRVRTKFTTVTVPPGGSVITLRSTRAAATPPGETRALGVCVFGIELAVARE